MAVTGSLVASTNGSLVNVVVVRLLVVHSDETEVEG